MHETCSLTFLDLVGTAWEEFKLSARVGLALTWSPGIRRWLMNATMGSTGRIHIDMDAFYASVPARRSTAAWQACHRRVARESFRSMRRFIRSTAVWSAFGDAGCSSGTSLPQWGVPSPRFSRYRAISPQAHEIFKRHTDLNEPLSIDEAYLDVTENKTGLPKTRLNAKCY